MTRSLLPRNPHARVLRGRALSTFVALLLGLAVAASACVPAPAPWTGDDPSGNLDSISWISPTQLRVSGWASDRNTDDPIAVGFFVFSRADKFGLLPVLLDGATLAYQRRADVKAKTGRAEYSGFVRDFSISETKIQLGSSLMMCAFAANVGPGQASSLGCRDIPAPPAPPQPVPTTTTTTTAAPVSVGDCDEPARPGVDWHNCDLSGADLSSSDLRGANLKGAKLSGADLRYSMLVSANLTGAVLTNANVSLADFSSANLERADLRSATVYATIFTGARTTGLKFTDGTWTDAICPDRSNSSANGNSCAGHWS